MLGIIVFNYRGAGLVPHGWFVLNPTGPFVEGGGTSCPKCTRRLLRVFRDARSAGRSSENHSFSSELGRNGVSLSRWVCHGLTRVGDSLKKQVRPPEKAENVFHSSDPL